MTVTDTTAGAADASTAANQAMLSALRSVLIGIGGILAANGITMVGGFSVQTIIGGVMMVAPAVWGFVQKYQAKRELVKAQTVAVQAGVAAHAAGAVPPVPAAAITPAQAQTIIAAHAPTP